MKTLLYCQHSVGIGHLMRMLRLAEQLIQEGEVTLVVGGELPARQMIPAGVNVVALPALSMELGGTLLNERTADDVPAVFAGRRAQLAGQLTGRRFDVLVVEMFPFGRKKFVAEVEFLIGLTRRANPQIKVFSSVRDVLITTRADQRAHDQRAACQLNKLFDAVLVHSDPRLIRLEETFSALSDVQIPVHYTGYISSSRSRTSTEPVEERVVVSAGGGRVGNALLQSVVGAAAMVRACHKVRFDVIAGALSATAVVNDQNDATTQIRMLDYVPDLPGYMRTSRLSISQCGYNTAVDILQTGVPALVVPFETDKENEQIRRANLLAAKGYLSVLRVSELSAERLAQSVVRILHDTSGGVRGQTVRQLVDLEGAQNSVQIMREYVHAAQ